MFKHLRFLIYILLSLYSFPLSASSLTVDRISVDSNVAPSPPVINSLTTNDTTPVISGTAEAGVTINVSISGGANYTTTAGNDGVWQTPTSSTLAEGTYTIRATATNSSNESSTQATAALVIDTTAPPAPIFDTLATNSVTPTLTGTAEPNSDILITISGVSDSTTTSASGEWSLVWRSLAEGSYTPTLTATDLAGNTSQTSSGSLIIDTTDPVTPTIQNLVTNDVTPDITGSAEAGSTVSVTVDGNSYSAVANDGIWIITSLTLSDGTYTVTASATDPSGNQSSLASGTLEIDTIIPNAPNVNDLQTNDQTPTITGTAEQGALVSISINNDSYNVTASNNGNWSIDITTPLADSNYTVNATAMDAAGNVSAQSSGTLVVDSTPPNPPIVSDIITNDSTPVVSGTGEINANIDFRIGAFFYETTVDGNGNWTIQITSSLSDSNYFYGVTATDTFGNESSEATANLKVDTTPPVRPSIVNIVTTDQTPSITGTAESGSTVSVTVDGSSYATTANSGGLWTVTTTALDDGTYTVSAKATDAAGNESSQGTGSLTVDSTPPTTPTVNALTTADTTPTITGTAEINSSITITVGGNTYTGTTDGNGNWAITVTTALSDGSYTVNVTATDNASNVSPQGSGTITIDSIVPVAPTVTALTTADTTPTITGTAEAGSTVTVTVDGAVYTTTATGGTWSVTTTTVLSDGTYTASATATDAAGNVSPQGTGSLTVDSTPPSTPTVNNLRTNDTTPSITGTAEAGSTVSVTVDGSSYSTTANSGGLWTVTTTALDDGTYTVSAKATDATGNESSQGTGSLTVDSTPPTTPTVNALTTADTTPTVTGNAEAGSLLTINIDNSIYNTQSDGNGNWAITVTTALSDGSYTVNVTATDNASNVSPQGSGTITIDSTAPVAPTVTALTTADTTPTITGTAEAGSMVTVTVDGAVYTTTATGGTWSITTTVLSDGTYTVSATATDAAGNVSPQGTGSLTVDSTPPSTPTVNNLKTNDTTPSITGTAEAGSTVSVTVDGSSYATTANSGGLWTVTTTALDDGTYTVSAKATDAAGNESSQGTGSLTVDSTPPTTPTVNALTTADTTPTITGTAEINSSITITVGGNTYTGTTDGNGNWSIGVTAALSDDTYTVTATAADALGNTSAAGTGTLTIDTTAPVAPTVTALTTADTTPTITGTAEAGSTVTVTVDGAVYTTTATGGTWSITTTVLSDGTYTVSATATDEEGNTSQPGTGTLIIDTTAPDVPTINNRTTTDTTPRISGTAEANASITVTVDGNTYPATAGSNGSWFVDVTSSLIDGTYTVSATAADALGNTSAAATGTLIIDTTAPAVPTINNLTTADTTPTITGTAEINSSITITVGGNTYTGTTDGNGNWSIGVTAALSDDTYTVTATAADALGNTSAAGTGTLTIDTTAPVAPTVTALTTADTTPTITGTAEAGSTVTVTVDGAVYTTTATGGTWSITTTVLSDGTYTVSATATDEEGNTSQPGTGTLIIDTTAPDVPTINNRTTTDTTPRISGTAEANASITVTVDGNTYPATAGSNGSWFVDVTSSLIDGTYTVSATAADALGNTSAAATGTLIIDTTAPAVPTINNLTTADTTPTITGTAEINSSITITVGGNTYTGTTDGNGNWSIGVTAALSDDTYTVTATAADALGNTSAAGTGTLTIDTTAPVAPTVTALTTADTTPTITGTAEAGSTVTVTVDGAVYTTTATGGTWSITTTVLSDGTYTVSATATDEEGNTSQPGTGTLIIDTTAPDVPTINNRTTTDTTPRISGTAEANASITVTVDGNTYPATAGSNGSWFVDVTSSLIDGTYTVSATAADALGNTSAAATGTLIIDTTAPAVPTINNLTTADTTPTITGTAEINSSITITVGGNTYTGTTDGNGNWSIGVTAALSDDTYTVTATAADALGNTSAAGTGTLTIDTTAPVAPTVTALTTADTTPTITGTAEAGSTVTVTVDGAVYTTTATGGTWSITTTVLSDGTYTVSATATDEEGNTSQPGTGSLTVDSAPPAVPTINNLTTADTTPTITGTAEINSSITITVGGNTYTGTTDGNGNWSIGVTAALSDDTYTVTATAADALGNTSVAGTGTLIIDTTAPAVPTINNLTTADTTPTITGTAEINSSITITVGGNTYTGTTDGNGNWSIGVTAALSDDTYTVTATAADALGNTSAAGTGTLTIDSTAPVAPTVTSQTIDDSTPTITGTAEPGSTVSVTIDDTVYIAIAGSNQAWSVEITSPLFDGTYTVSATATDSKGNTSQPGTGTLIIDTTAPNAPIINSISTKDTTPTLTGTAEPGSSVSLIVNGNTYSAITGENGSWNIDVTRTLADGSYPIRGTAQDQLGNVSSEGNGVLLIDTTPPPAPTINDLVTNDRTPTITGTAEANSIVTVTLDGAIYTVTADINGLWEFESSTLSDGTYEVIATAKDDLDNVSGEGSGTLTIDTTEPITPTVDDKATRDTTPVVTGTGESGTTISVSVDGGVYFATVNNNGDWSVEITAPLVDGTYSVRATSTDAAENISETGFGALVVDTMVPDVPIINDLATNDSTPEITGTAEPGTTVTFTLDGITYSAIVATNGAWSINITNDLSDNIYTIVARAEDTLGNLSEEGRGILEIDTTAPNPPTIEDLISNDITPIISGTSEPNATINLIVDLTSYQFEADSNGEWSYEINTVAENTYSMRVTATDSFGNESAESVGTLVIDVTDPSKPTVNNQTTKDPTPTITGTAEAETNIEITINGVVYPTTADGIGNWEITTLTLNDGTYSITVVSIDAAGNESLPGNGTIEVDANAPLAPIINDLLTKNITPTITGTAESGSTVSVTVDNSNYSFVADNNGNWAITTVPLADGVYPVSATSTDASGNVSNTGFGTLTIDATPPAVPTVISQLTSDTTPDIIGTAEPESLVSVTINGTEYEDTADDNGDWIITTSPLPDGDYSITVVSTDAAGNDSNTVTGTLTIDATSPLAPIIVNQSTRDTTPTITGTAEAGSTIRMTVNGVVYTATTDPNGDWSATVTNTLPDNTYTVSATATDAALNVSSPGTGSLLVDATAPEAPTINDLITNDTTPTITGTAEAGSTVTITVGMDVYTTTATGDGNWSILSNVLGEADYVVRATATDVLGNESAEATGSLEIDITAPADPVVTYVSATEIVGTATADIYVQVYRSNGTTKVANTNADSSGDYTISFNPIRTHNETLYVSTFDVAGNESNKVEVQVDAQAPVPPVIVNQSTRDTTPTITGTAEAGSTIRMTVNGVVYTATTDPNGDWSATVTNTLPDNTYTVSATATDAALNVSSPGTGSLLVDATAPEAPTINDLITNDTTPTITGTAEAGSTVTITVGMDVYTTTATGDGNWSILSNVLGEADYVVRATATDVLGNESAEATGSLEIDITAPADPVVTYVSATEIVGTATADIYVQVYRSNGTTKVANTNADSSGDYTISFNPIRTHNETLYVSTFDVAGNESNKVEVQVDAQAPVPPVIVNQSTRDTTPTITGTAEAGSTIRMTVNGVVYTATTDPNGDWSATVTNTLPDNTYTVSATATDAALNVSSPGTGSLLVDATAPEAPTINDLITNDTTPTITGTAEAGSTVTITVGMDVYTTTATGDGNWSILSNVLGEADYVVRATATDVLGNESAEATGSLEIDITAPADPVVTYVSATEIVGTATADIYVQVYRSNGTTKVANTNADSSGDYTISFNPIRTHNETLYVSTFDVAGNESNKVEVQVDAQAPVPPVIVNQSTRDTTPTITGTAEAGSTIRMTVNGVVYTATTDPNGDWSATVTNTLPDNTYTVSATATDAALNVSSPGTGSLLVDATAPEAPTINDLITNDTTPTITGTAEAGSTVTITVGTDVYTTTATGDGNWSILSNVLGEAVYVVRATATDVLGNVSQEERGTLNIDLTAPGAPVINDLITNDQTPIITGTAEVGSTVTVTVNNSNYSVIVDNIGEWAITTTILFDDEYTVTAIATDLAGNTSTVGSGSLEVDTIAPLRPTINDKETADNTPAVTGTAEAASTVTLTVDGLFYTTTADTDGNWGVEVTNALDDDLYTMTATATDAAGNVSPVTSGTLLIDTTAPNPPIIDALITNDQTPLLTGSAEELSVIKLTVNNILYTGNTDGNGDWAIQVTNVLPEDEYTVRATATDALDNESIEGTELLVIDLTAPDAPVVNDLITNDQTPDITGTAEALSTLSVTVNGVTYTTEADTSGLWSVNTTTLLFDNTYTVTATATDLAGNTSTVGSGSLEIDTVAPLRPTINDKETADNTPAITGTAEIGSTVILTVDGLFYTTTADADGNWGVEVTDALDDDLYIMTATATDAAGNVSPVTSGTLLIDTTPPNSPIIDALTTNDQTPLLTGSAEELSVIKLTVNNILYTGSTDGNGDWAIQVTNVLPEDEYTVRATATDALDNESIEGTELLVIDLTAPDAPVVNDLITNDQTPNITGTAEALSTLSVTVNGVTYTTEADTSGLWSVTTTLLFDNTYTVTATATDLAGNTSTVGSGSLEIDTIAPVRPIINGGNELKTNDRTPGIAGTAEPQSQITAFLNGLNYITSADANGNWGIEVTNDLQDGEYTIVATSRDAAGNVSAQGFGTVIVDATAPDAPIINALTTNNQTPTITGTAEAGSQIRMTVDGNIYTTITDSSSNWSATITATLEEGTYVIRATATDRPFGNQSVEGTTDLVIDLTPPAPPVIDDQITNDTTPTITGTAEAFSTVILTLNNVNYTTTTAANGLWSIDITDLLRNGIYTVTATSTDVAGNLSDVGSGSLTIDTEAPAPPVFDQPNYATNDRTPDISGGAEIGAKITVTINERDYTMIADSNGSWSITTVTLQDGDYTMTATAEDVAGNVSAESFATLIIDATPPSAPEINDLITNDITPKITGTAEPASTIALLVAGEEYQKITDGNGNWALTISNELNEGEYTMRATATDALNNQSFVGTGDLTIDITPPPAPDVTLASTTRVEGSAEPASTIKVFKGETSNVVIGSGVVSSSGSFMVIYNVAQKDEDFVRVSSTDQATNESDSVVVEIDKTAPEAPIINDLQTNISTPVITGTAESDSEIKLTIAGITYTTSADFAGAWNILVNFLEDGEYQMVATATNSIGNESIPGVGTLIIDATPPVAPEIFDLITNDITPLIRGISEPESLVNLSVRGVAGFSTITDANGNWEIQIDRVLSEGIYEIIATATDNAENVSPQTNAELVIDLTPPMPPVVYSQSTNDTTPTIAGTAESGTKVSIALNGNLYNRDVDINGKWTLELTSPLEEGVYTIEVVATDLAQNESDTGRGVLEIDITAPDAPIMDELVTNDTSPTITGSAEPGSKISLLLSGETYFTETNANGIWSFPIPVELLEGSYEIRIRAEDKVRNESEEGIGILVIDLTSPEIPVVDDLSINDNTPVISGTGEPRGTVSILIDGKYYSSVISETGVWQTQVTDPLKDDTYLITATITDRAGNKSDEGFGELILDTLAPEAPIVDNLYTKDTTPDITGKAEPLSKLLIIVNDREYFTSADSQGNWVITLAKLIDGEYSIEVYATDSFENTSEKGLGLLTIDTIKPESPLIVDLITNDTTPEIRGSTEPFNKVIVYVNGEAYETQADDSGAWIVDKVKTLRAGRYTISALSEDQAGNSSDLGVGDLIIDTTPPILTKTGSVIQPALSTYSIVENKVLVYDFDASENVEFILSRSDQETFKLSDQGVLELITPPDFEKGQLSFIVYVIIQDLAGNTASNRIEVLIENTLDEDTDGDGVLDVDDEFPNDPSESIDTDGDGIGDNADTDDDGDGVSDIDDDFPLDPDEAYDTDGDGIGNNSDEDDDGDGVPDIDDEFPLDPEEAYDTDGDGIGNNADEDDDGDGVDDIYDLCLSTPLGEAVDVNGCTLFSLPANAFSVISSPASCIGKENGKIKVSAFDQTLSYRFSISGNSQLFRLNQFDGYNRVVEGLSEGIYEVCITVDGNSQFKRCYTVTIGQPEPLNVVSEYIEGKQILDLQIEGASEYYVEVNGARTIGRGANFSVALLKGMNRIKVFTDQNCQGVYEEEIFISENVDFAPNPVQDNLYLTIGGYDNEAIITVIDLNGNVVEKQEIRIPIRRVYSLNMSRYRQGVYIVKINNSSVRKSLKVIKR